MYNSGQFNSSGQMNPMEYSAQMMGGNGGGNGDHMAQVPPPYARSPFSNKALMPGAQLVSSRIANDPGCGVFCHDGPSASAAELHVRQMIGGDGAVYVEHVPGYHVVYVAAGENIDQAIRDSRFMPGHQQQQRPQSKAASRASSTAMSQQRDRPLKPCNPFIMYRNHKITQMRKENPEINQTEISREAAKWWHSESDEVKEIFRAKYREEKQVYDMKKCKRGRAESCAAESESEAGADGLSTPSNKRSRNDASGLGISSSSRVTAKPRSRTMPNDMFGASGARTSIVTDLRKQLAARSGAAFFDASSPYDAATGMHHAYPDFSSPHQPMTIAPMVSYSPNPHEYALPPVGDYATEINAADYVLPPVGDYTGQPEYSSFVSVMHGMSGGDDQQHQQQQQQQTEAADFYAAAADSIAAAAAEAAIAAAASEASSLVVGETNEQQQAHQYAHYVSHSQSPAPQQEEELAAPSSL
ncbi:hypothetical protein GGI21_000352 [Coemansia aciculifera]|uniref:Uncharacterized protein n=1 Tax=Coemansia aciculifera TaxID=417176 RepID=A0ACC1M6D3_9FUNG|nr:hypothetical protein IWW38_001278 [Coemansia aciculifera]KAJ2910929.1 hypothetical protein GGI21_000352 [Coemansia aciculifera]